LKFRVGNNNGHDRLEHIGAHEASRETHYSTEEITNSVDKRVQRIPARRSQTTKLRHDLFLPSSTSRNAIANRFERNHRHQKCFQKNISIRIDLKKTIGVGTAKPVGLGSLPTFGLQEVRCRPVRTPTARLAIWSRRSRTRNNPVG